jgi:hypothetical protein
MLTILHLVRIFVQNDGAAISGSSSSLASSIVVPQLSSTGKVTPGSPMDETGDTATDVGSASEAVAYTGSEQDSASDFGRYSLDGDREEDWDMVTDDTDVSSGEDEL